MRILTVAMVLLLSACGGNEKPTETSINETVPDTKERIDFIKTMEGEIGDYPVIAKLNSNDGILKGSYYYTNKGVELLLKGSVGQDRRVTIQEFDATGNLTGIFKGNMVSDERIEGKWEKPDGSRSFDFFLVGSNSSYDSFKKDFEKLKVLEGEYHGAHSLQGNPGVILKMSYLEGNWFTFSIVDTDSRCEKQLIGDIEVIQGVGRFSSDLCTSLTLDLTETDKCKVTSSNCKFEDDWYCSINHTYKKQDAVVVGF